MSVEVEHLSFSYGSRRILEDVGFSLESGRTLSVLGPNGVGKSTLFRCILGLLTPSAGSVRIDGRDIARLSVRQRAEIVAYIPQGHAPSFNYSVYDMVLMGTAAQIGMGGVPDMALRSRAEEALRRLGIWHLRERGFLAVSGGEQQLACISRALAQGAKVLVMDEPTANLDYGNQIMVQTQLLDLAREGYTILQSTHDPQQAFMFSDRILALSGGKVDTCGTPREVMGEALIERLYRVPVTVESLANDRMRVCVPKYLWEEAN